jgi:hypothetical protein
MQCIVHEHERADRNKGERGGGKIDARSRKLIAAIFVDNLG